MPMPWEAYSICIISVLHGIIYNSYILSAPSYFHPNCITYRETKIDEPSPMRNDQFDHKNRSTLNNKRKVVKQVYRVKKDGRLNKNLDLILDKKKPNIDESSTSLLIKMSQ
jgi:hypothetical protein